MKRKTRSSAKPEKKDGRPEWAGSPQTGVGRGRNEGKEKKDDSAKTGASDRANHEPAPNAAVKGQKGRKEGKPRTDTVQNVQSGQPTGKGPTPLRGGQKGSREGRPRADVEQERRSGQATTLHPTPLRGGQKGSKEGKLGTEATPAKQGRRCSYEDSNRP